MKRGIQCKWTHVASSAVRAVRYHAARNQLDVRFEEGREYRYRQVPRSKFRALLQAESIGEFVNHEIKPHHPVQEIGPSARPRLQNIEELRNAN
jgi:hypothetical protein